MSAVPMAASRFLAIGSRIMLNPVGKLEVMIDAKCLLERTAPNPEPPAPFEARRRIVRSFFGYEKHHAQRLANLVRSKGQTVNGWLVWEAGQ